MREFRHRQWNDDSRKIDLAKDVGIHCECFGCLRQTLRKITPAGDATEVEKNLRYTVGRDPGNLPENHGEDDGRHDRLNQEPQGAQNGLLVQRNEVAVDQQQQQIPVAPDFRERD